MKKRNLIIAGIITIGVYFLYKNIKNKKSEKESDKNDSSSDLKEDDKKINSILFVGDSITANMSGSKKNSSVYSQLLINELKPKNIKVDVLAIGGKRTEWMLQNLQKVLSDKKYDRIYIYGGINDMFSKTSTKTAYSNIQKMVDLSLEKKSVPYVMVGYNAKNTMLKDKLVPTKYVPTKDEMYRLAQRYFEFQKNIKSNIKNAKFVDMFEIGNNTYDGVHPNATGHKIIKNEVLKTIL